MPEERLHHDEQVVLNLRPHWRLFVAPVLVLIGAITLGIVALVLEAPQAVNVLVGLLIIVALLWFGVRFLRWSTTNFVLTTDRLISRHGILSRSGIEIPLERINTVFFEQTILERMMRSGDLRIESAGEMGTSLFTDIRRPLDVQSEIYRQIEANENRKFDRVGHHVKAATSIPEQIRELDELRRDGTISNSEFEAKKSELLRRM